LIRAHWKGLSGGTEVWQQIAEFFKNVKERAVEIADTSLAETESEEKSHA
jgi:hypothetical protein